jgi:GNAT superfamily N-acetyltransferase
MAGQTVASSVRIRRATNEDSVLCGRICYDAFVTINRQHNFPPEITSPEAASFRLGMLFSHSRFYCVVAECGGRVVGSNCMDERCTIAGIGPITVDPAVQNKNIGKALMTAVLDRAREQAFPGVRLLQATFHSRSLSLYTKLGFDVRELILVMHGPALQQTIDGCSVRPATHGDLDAANNVCERVHGHNRSGELTESIDRGTAMVVERYGAITGYASGFGYPAHAVGESNVDLKALISAVTEIPTPGILVPARNSELFRWCLAKGMRVVQPMTLMTIGLYSEPRGAYMPSVLY